MSNITSIARRFIPDDTYQADLGVMPMDDSCVTTAGMSDAEEIREYQQGFGQLSESADPEPSIDHDEAFGDVVVRHAGQDRPGAIQPPASIPAPSERRTRGPGRKARRGVSLQSWGAEWLVELLTLADRAGDAALSAAAAAELLSRIHNGASAA